MKQYTVVFKNQYGRRFRFIEAVDMDDAKLQVYLSYPEASILSIRENNPPLETIEAR